MEATEDIAELNVGTDVQATQSQSRLAQSVKVDKGFDGPKAAVGSKKKKKKKKKTMSTSSVVIYGNLNKGTFKVTENAIAGRCVVAAKDLAEGESILDEPPFAKVIRRDCSLRHCGNCCRQIHESAGLEATADVYYTAYCSQACKKQDAALRDGEGDAVGKLGGISTIRDVDLDLLRMLLRLLVMRATALGLRPMDSNGVRMGGTEQQDCEDETTVTKKGSTFLREQWHNVRCLMDHKEKMAPEWIRVVRAAAEDLMMIVPAWVRAEVDEAVGLACQINVNAHGLRDDSGGNHVIGVGLFPLTAMINHSCKPNCTFFFHDGKMEVRALEVIKAGSELNVHYIDLLHSTPDRRRELLASKHFVCACSRCENPGPADAYLDGACCVDCGEDGCLTSTMPLSPEDALAAQLAELGADVAKLEQSRAPSGKRKMNKKTTNDLPGVKGGSNVTAARREDTSSTHASAVIGRENDFGVTGSSGEDGVMYCSACGRKYPTVVVTDCVARAKLLRNAARSAVPAKDLSASRKVLEKWLEDFDAGYVTPPSAPKKSKKLKLKLHPSNAMVVQTLVQLVNCCNFEKDYSTSAKYLKRAIYAMECVYPLNYPELGDFHAALADALTAFLGERGEALPKKLKSQAIRGSLRWRVCAAACTSLYHVESGERPGDAVQKLDGFTSSSYSLPPPAPSAHETPDVPVSRAENIKEKFSFHVGEMEYVKETPNKIGVHWCL